jgi:SAM-dependent methyltransferase
VLDLGAGDGRHTVEASRWPCHVVAVEIDPNLLRLARAYVPREDGAGAGGHTHRGKADFILADAEHLPFKGAAFDKVLCTEVLEHIPDDKAGIRELYRVAKPGSQVAVSVPRAWPERVNWTLSWEYWHTPGGHVRIYRPGEMAGYLGAHGFDVQFTRYRHAFQAFYWFLRCTFGKDNERSLVPHTVWRFINWYHNTRPSLLERIEAVANLVAGKDMIIYTRKPAGPSANGQMASAEIAQSFSGHAEQPAAGGGDA